MLAIPTKNCLQNDLSLVLLMNPIVIKCVHQIYDDVYNNKKV